jgi:FkbM family methyltransferase
MPSKSSGAVEDYGAYAPQGLVAQVLRVTRQAGSGWLSRRMAFFLRRIAIQALKGRPVDTEALGSKMRLFPYKNVCEKRILFTPQFFDAEELAFLKADLKPNYVFLDIGANIGGYSLFVASHAGTDAQILAIEPQPDIYDRLVYNLRLNPRCSAKALACAVADKDTEVTLFVSDDNKGQSSLKVISDTNGVGEIRVPARKLKELIEQQGFDHVDAAKLDTEGAEDLILETFFAEAPKALWPRMLILERGSDRWSVDLPKLLVDRGYKVERTTKNNTIYRLQAET